MGGGRASAPSRRTGCADYSECVTSDTTPHSPASQENGEQVAATTSHLDEQLLGGPRRYTLSELERGTGLSHAFIESYWRWLGLPVTHPTERWYTDADMESLRDIAALIDAERLDEQAQMTLIRAVGHTTERLALWQVEALVEHMSRADGLDDVSARQAVLERIPHLADQLSRQIDHAWRRQLAALTGRLESEFGGARGDHADDEHRLPLRRAVGFADIVSFTKRTAGLGSHELAEFVQEFESRARDVIAEAGGRVVKTIGDAVLFVADDVSTGAEVALGLATPHATAEEIPVRVGFVWGRVLSRFGDVFGPDVNKASRLTELAEPSTVLVDPATAALLASSARYALTAQPERDLPGIGPIVPVRLQRAYTGA